jgi:CheY-like chemotaxis protein
MMIDNKHILVVDDEQHMTRLMAYNLRKEGYEVNTASNGVEALRHVEEKKPDLILLDIKMPVMNGYEVCVKLKERPETRNIPVIVVSVLADQEEIASLEVNARVAKPFDPVKLVDEVRSILNTQKAGGGQ